MSEETLRVVVRRRESQGQGVLVLDLAPADGGELPPFEAGAHVDLHLGEGLVRQYSLCGNPADRQNGYGDCPCNDLALGQLHELQLHHQTTRPLP